MVEPKTAENDTSVTAFLDAADDARKREDSYALFELMREVTGCEKAFLDRLGMHKAGESCLYLKRLDDVDLEVLRKLVRESVRHVAERYAEVCSALSFSLPLIYDIWA